MNERWRAKLDPWARAAMDEGEPAGPVDVLVALYEPLTPAIRNQLEAAGLNLVSDTGTVVSGNVSDWTALKRVVAVDVVRRIELCRPLLGEGA